MIVYTQYEIDPTIFQESILSPIVMSQNEMGVSYFPLVQTK